MSAELDRAAGLIRGGGVIAYPTDTVWGVGGDARRPDVVARVRALKGRDGRPMLVLAESLAHVADWLAAVPQALSIIADAKVAATLLCPASPDAPPALVGPDGWIGVRCPSGWAGALCARAGSPVLSSSANRSGAPAPATRGELSEHIARGVDAVIEGPEPAGGAPSTLVRADGEALVVLRAGAVSAETLEELTGCGVRSPRA